MIKSPLVLSDGKIQQLQAGDTLDVPNLASDIAANAALIAANTADIAADAAYLYGGPGQLVIVPYTFALQGVGTSPVNLFGSHFDLATGLTANNATEHIVGNNKVHIIINSLIGSGTITLTGDSVNVLTGVPTLATTDVLTVDQPGRWVSTKMFFRITNVTIGAGITAINYNIHVHGTSRLPNVKSKFIGYRADILKSGAGSASLRLEIHSLRQISGQRYQSNILEDITMARHPAITDNLRVGADARSYNSNVANYVDSTNIVFTLRQIDFDTYFTNQEHYLDPALDEGLQAIFTWAQIDFMVFYALFIRIPSA